MSSKGIEGKPLHFTKRAENHPQHEVKALRAALKESEQRLVALEAKFNKFDSFLYDQVRTTSGRRRRGRSATTARELTNQLKVMMNLYACKCK